MSTEQELIKMLMEYGTHKGGCRLFADCSCGWEQIEKILRQPHDTKITPPWQESVIKALEEAGWMLSDKGHVVLKEKVA